MIKTHWYDSNLQDGAEPPKKGSGKKVVLHPRIVPRDTVSTDRLIEEAVFAFHLY